MATIDPTTITSLRSRLEALTGDDPEVYAAVATALLPGWDWEPAGTMRGEPFPRRSRMFVWWSAHAWESFALALVARVLPGWGVDLGTSWRESSEREPRCGACLSSPDEHGSPEDPEYDVAVNYAPTLSLALLKALLTATEFPNV